MSGKSNSDVPKKEKAHYLPSSWDEISNNLYLRIEWYASKFITISVWGVVIGFIGIVYGLLSMWFFGSEISALGTFLGFFVGFGALIASVVLLLWGVFWRRRVENHKIL
ncbi:MAG: hypothetical protein C4K47_04175 [Candidatus Thorarchaeota archaeon]|nr:MAG: hypothetical protein C4K47_04175 [Candidatus Thorarchaeota archaeon]